MPPVVRLLEQAVELQGLLATRQVRFRAELADRCGVSAMRITQILALLKLAPEIQAYVRSLPSGTPARRVTERRLRPLTALDETRQIAVALRELPGFLAWRARSDPREAP